MKILEGEQLSLFSLDEDIEEVSENDEIGKMWLDYLANIKEGASEQGSKNI